MPKIFIILFSIFTIFSQINLAFSEEYEDDFFELEDDLSHNNNQLAIYDPLENINRKIFHFNEKADKYFMRPINEIYRFIAPKIVRSSIKNFLHNLSRPFDIVNSLLQGDMKNARASFSDFLIDSTIGLVGIFDIAKSKNINFKEQNFGKTLNHYNIPSGPYLVLPFLGPSNIRNFSGFLVEKSVDPLSINMLKLGNKKDLLPDRTSYQLTTIRMINQYDEISDILANARQDSFDLYATIRAFYIQSQN
jgi:phospholipid-binding lipoprotein MlaA